MSKKAKLIIRKGPNAGQTITVTEHKFQIGRNRQCDLVLSDPSVSRIHASLRYYNDMYYLQDAQSLAGTYVNNIRINATQIHPGDVIRIGESEIIFELEFSSDEVMIFQSPTKHETQTEIKTEFLFENTLMDNEPASTTQFTTPQATVFSQRSQQSTTAVNTSPKQSAIIDRHLNPYAKPHKPLGSLGKSPYDPEYRRQSGCSLRTWLGGLGLFTGVIVVIFTLSIVLGSNQDTPSQGILQPSATPSLIGQWEALARPGFILTFGTDGIFINGDGENGTYTRAGNLINTVIDGALTTMTILSESPDEIVLRIDDQVYLYRRIR